MQNFFEGKGLDLFRPNIMEGEGGIAPLTPHYRRPCVIVRVGGNSPLLFSIVPNLYRH